MRTKETTIGCHGGDWLVSMVGMVRCLQRIEEEDTSLFVSRRSRCRRHRVGEA